VIVGKFERSSLESLVGTLVFSLLGFNEGLDVGSSLLSHLKPNRPSMHQNPSSTPKGLS